jgi:predicted enzyme related to lactoylglutathione lyase
MSHPTLANGKICYLEIPAEDVEQSSSFYHNVFGWHIRKRSDGQIAFDDTVNEVSGTWVVRRESISEVGVLIYIMVNDINATIEAIVMNGGMIVQEVNEDDPEVIARFADPAGNIFGIFQQ